MIKNYSVGARFYDEKNDRYIKIDQIQHRDCTASCTVSEYNEAGDLDKEYYQLFTLEELKHFKEV